MYSYRHCHTQILQVQYRPGQNNTYKALLAGGYSKSCCHSSHIQLPSPYVKRPSLWLETSVLCNMHRVGQNHKYAVYVWYIWQGNHQIYGHIRRIYTVLANPICTWERYRSSTLFTIGKNQCPEKMCCNYTHIPAHTIHAKNNDHWPWQPEAKSSVQSKRVLQLWTCSCAVQYTLKTTIIGPGNQRQKAVFRVNVFCNYAHVPA